MLEGSPRHPDIDTWLAAFRQSLLGCLQFQEDVALLTDLLGEVRPVLDVLWRTYRAAPDCNGAGTHEAFALFHLLCRRAGLLGATPTFSLGLFNALQAALEAAGVNLQPFQAEQLRMIAVEGYSAGRDEQRERHLRTEAARAQVCCPLAPRCSAVFLAGSHLPEHLGPILDTLARDMFRGDVRSVLLDLSRLEQPNEESARLVVSFAATLHALGAHIVVYGPGAYGDWLDRLGLCQQGVHLSDDFAEARAQALSAAGMELKPKSSRRLGALLARVRSAAR